eukprot:CAMPEP_0196662652 /NCGR_PEP_ID=MMETSP1086-20130531/49767_1 /TAXON_ID=77921 /ORGANISM="Cyanoptyche  gloeocystis , Strain SAG4.97" /LENGTH=59 /DNA_ID=CAMNT_0041998165 /DNA_START=329 /DNA_END=505 /DNA_ORIENTATION=-
MQRWRFPFLNRRGAFGDPARSDGPMEMRHRFCFHSPMMTGWATLRDIPQVGGAAGSESD